MIKATRGRAAKFRRRAEKVTLLNELDTKGRTPSWAVRERSNMSLILRGRRGKYFMIRGKKRMIARVAEKVSWKPRLKRLKGFRKSRMKALMEIVLMRLTFFQMSLPRRKARVMIVALMTEGLPSTKKA
jgi:hypothetical protein